MVDRSISWKYMVAGLGITFLVVGTIFVAGRELTEVKVDSLEGEISELEMNQQSRFLTYRMAGELETGRCRSYKTLRTDSLEDLYEVRRKLTTHENAGKISSPNYKDLKKKYNLLLIEDYLQKRRAAQECSRNSTRILYFYEQRCDKCDTQSKILTSLRRDVDDVFVYPIDTGIELSAVDYLSSYHNVSAYPTLVVNGNKSEGIVYKNQLRNMFHAQ
jgi:hypothetical protein